VTSWKVTERLRRQAAALWCSRAPLPSVRSSRAVDRLARLQRGDRAAQPHPERLVRIERCAPRHDRSICGRSAGFVPLRSFECRRHSRAKAGIVQIEPAVAAEHRNAFVERLQGLALDADQRFVAPHQLQSLGHVVEQISDAPFRVRRSDDAQGAVVRQIPFMLARLDRPVGIVQLGFPFAEVCLLGSLRAARRPVEHG
jgi:hypothetical protein